MKLSEVVKQKPNVTSNFKMKFLQNPSSTRGLLAVFRTDWEKIRVEIGSVSLFSLVSESTLKVDLRCNVAFRHRVSATLFSWTLSHGHLLSCLDSWSLNLYVPNRFIKWVFFFFNVFWKIYNFVMLLSLYWEIHFLKLYYLILDCILGKFLLCNKSKPV